VIQLDVFTPLSEGVEPIEQLAEGLKVLPTKLKPLMHALVSAGPLEVENERFPNTSEANYYSARGGPCYRYPSLARRWEAILKTAETIHTGIPQAKVGNTEASPADLELFFRGRHADTLAIGQDLVSRYDFLSHRQLVDIAGGSGGVAIALARACPSLHATVLDLTSVTPVTQWIVDETDVARGIDVVS